MPNRMLGSDHPRSNHQLRPRRRLRLHSAALSAATLLTLALGIPRAAAAQSFRDLLKQKVKDKQSALADSLSGVIVDKATGLVQCVATNIKCIKKSFASGKNVKLVDANGNPLSPTDSANAVAAAGGVPPQLAAADAKAAANQRPVAATSADPAAATAFGSGLFMNYDFVPGDSVLYANDFSTDQAGDFPHRLGLKSGNFEAASWQGQMYLRTNSGGSVIVPLPVMLPDRFTFEADYSGGTGWDMVVHFADPDAGDFTVGTFSPAEGGFTGSGVNSTSQLPDGTVNPIAHLAVMADGHYAKAYVNGVRVANVPNANLGRSTSLIIDFVADQDTPAYLTNIRVAAGGKPLYDAIMADGRVATHGILFATGSDHIGLESKPTLDLIGKMLIAHPELKLTIEGHTDNVGAADANQTLSEQRAASVRQYLMANYRIAASRLASAGYGDTKPVASNATPEGRQQNRRVELVKM